MEEQFAFNGQAKNMGQKREFEFLRSVAFSYLNAPYQWGGKSPFGIDCSGFVQMVFRIGGYPLYRDAWQQANQGKPIGEFSDARPGDLLFFQNEKGAINHVGIALPEDKIIHASGRVRVDQCSEAGIYSAEKRVITHRFSHTRRILAEALS